MVKRIFKYSVIFVFMASLLHSCGSSRKGVQAPSDDSSVPVLSFVKADAEEEMPLQLEVMTSERKNSSTMKFASDLLRTSVKVEGAKKNLVISPLSAGYALSLLLEGASGKTETELREVLGGSFEGIVPYTDDKTIVNTASSVWLKDGITILDSYRNAIESKFSAQVYTRDFSQRSTVGEINAWCSKHTAGRIPSIVGELPRTTVMMLLNALYFKAPWDKPFNEDLTRKGTFHAVGGDQTDVSLMNRTGSMLYGRRDNHSSLILDYESRYSMLIILPDEGTDLASVVSSLDAESFEREFNEMYSTRVELKLPKFTLETKIALNPILQGMGIKAAYQGGFSNMTNFPVAVSDVNQKCFLKVNEEGAEAAAVTSISMRLTSVAPSQPVRFHVDRPFVFAIYDRQTKDIYFEGCIVKIEGTEV